MTSLTRRIELDVPAEEVWPLLAEPEGWRRWLADDADVDLRPGGRGRVVEDGVARRVEIDTVDAPRRVAFRWWPEDDESDESRVEVVLVAGGEDAPPSTVVVTETRGDHLAATASVRLWLAASCSVGSARPLHG
jgi:uncharacterized protein YndB with AHSA1/START domain